MVRDISEANMDRARSFLERHSATAMFLLSNLASDGPKLGDGLNSGNFKCVAEAGEICAVFCLARRGNLLVETAGRTDLAAAILDACAAEPFPIRGVLGEWESSLAIWRMLEKSPGFVESFRSKELLFRLDLSAADDSPDVASRVRLLRPEDFSRWEPLRTAYLQEEGLPVDGTRDQRRALFEDGARAGYWWGYLEGDRLLATVALNAVYETTGQVGGVYTEPDRRLQGLARTAMRALMTDSVRLHGLRTLILFTGEASAGARRLYESLGFTRIGDFALLFCEDTRIRNAAGSPDS